MSVRELIERYNDAWNRQDLETIGSLHHPAVVFENHTAGERAEGAEAVREHIARIFRNNPDMRFTTRSLRTGDDFAVCEWTLNVTKDGRRLEWDGPGLRFTNDADANRYLRTEYRQGWTL